MKELKIWIKENLASLIYYLYQKGILHNSIEVMSIDETIDLLKKSNKSLVRYGDAEIGLIFGRKSVTQEVESSLQERLVEVLTAEEKDLEIGICDIFHDLDAYHESSKNFWKEHLLLYRKVYKKYCKPHYKYCNAFVTRCYYLLEDKTRCEYWFEQIRNIWENKDLVIVEGNITHNGVKNDLFSKANSVERIICPSRDAFYQYNKILDCCCEFGKEKLFLVSLGATAKALSYDLYKKGYRVIDIGNLDLEYEWFLKKADHKMPLEKRNITGIDENIKAGYQEYLNQIKYTIE